MVSELITFCHVVPIVLPNSGAHLEILVVAESIHSLPYAITKRLPILMIVCLSGTVLRRNSNMHAYYSLSVVTQYMIRSCVYVQESTVVIHATRACK